MSEFIINSKPTPTQFDFLWIWQGCSAILRSIDPYGVETTLAIQQGALARTLSQNEYQQYFAYPVHIIFLFAPLAMVSYEKAILIWLTLQLPLLFAAIYILTISLEFRLSRLQSILLFFLSSILFIFPLITYFIGQTSILLLFLLSSAGALISRRRILPGGVILALTSIRPDYFLLALLIALYLMPSKKEKWELVRVTGVTGIFLLLTSIGIAGFWMETWINVVIRYSKFNPFNFWPASLIGNQSVSFLIATLLIWIIWSFVRAEKVPTLRNKLFFVSGSIFVFFILNNLTGMYALTLLIIPIFILLSQAKQGRSFWFILSLFLVPILFLVLFPIQKLTDLALLLPLLYIFAQQVLVAFQGLPDTPKSTTSREKQIN